MSYLNRIMVFFTFLAIVQPDLVFSLDMPTLKPMLIESDASLVECHLNSELELGEIMKNWGENICFQPKYVFVPQTTEGICNIVKWAAQENLRIRVSGYRHTWNPVYPDEGQVLISLLGLDYLNSHKASVIVNGNTGAGEEFRKIAYVTGSIEPDKIFCKVGGAVTNDELRDFCLNTSDPFFHCFWSIPCNVILVENTFSGTISSICHGAGHANKTLSDLVEEIEFVNAQGKVNWNKNVRNGSR